MWHLFIHGLLSIAGHFIASLGWGTIAMMAAGAVLAMLASPRYSARSRSSGRT